MRELGYIEGKNLVIEWRFADNKPDRLSDLAAELVQLKVDVLVTARNARHPFGAESNDHDTHRHGRRRGSSPLGSGQEPGATRRKYHGVVEPR